MGGAVPQEAMNFSHRINLLSFAEGDVDHGANTLDGDIQTTDQRYKIYQYFVKVLPTMNKAFEQPPFWSNQYSVTEQHETITEASPFGGGRIAGIFIKYDIEPIMVTVTEDRTRLSSFFIRVFGIIGGIFATMGMLHQAVMAVHGNLQGQLPVLKRTSLDGEQTLG